MKKPTEKAKKTTSQTKVEKSTKAEKETMVVEASSEGTAAKKKTKREAKAEASGQPQKNCRIKNCKREYRAKGYCRTHYRMWRNGAYGRARYTCCGDYGCFRPMANGRHGYCEEHFQNYYVRGMEVTRVPAVAPATAPAAKVEEKAAS